MCRRAQPPESSMTGPTRQLLGGLIVLAALTVALVAWAG